MRDQRLVLIDYGNMGDKTSMGVLLVGARGGKQVRRWIHSSGRFGRPQPLGQRRVLGPAPSSDPRTGAALEALDAEARAAAAGRAALRAQRGT